MRTRYNGFVKFMCKVDGKEYKPARSFRYKEEWPGECNPIAFKTLVTTIVREYTPGDILSEALQILIDRAIVWDSHPLENEFICLYEGSPLTNLTFQLFENWNWRLANGEEPQRYNSEGEDLGEQALPY